MARQTFTTLVEHADRLQACAVELEAVRTGLAGLKSQALNENIGHAISAISASLPELHRVIGSAAMSERSTVVVPTE
jgi:hypothetical protein